MPELSPHTRTRRDGKKVRAHRWIMEQHLGRKLQPGEQVHHINKNPLDNRVENLTVLPTKVHMQLHKQIYPDAKECANCGQTFTANPRKRKRQKCCCVECANALRTRNMARTRGYEGW